MVFFGPHSASQSFAKYFIVKVLPEKMLASELLKEYIYILGVNFYFDILILKLQKTSKPK